MQKSSLLSFPSNVYQSTETSQATELLFVLPDGLSPWSRPLAALALQPNTN